MLLQFHRTLHMYCYNLWLVLSRRNGRLSAFSVLQFRMEIVADSCLVLSRLMLSVRVCVDGEEIMKNLRHERHFSATCSCPLNENVFLALTKHFFVPNFLCLYFCTFYRT